MHSTLHPCSSNQCNTARLESKLTSIQIMHISSHEIVHSFSYDAQRPSYQNPQRRYVAVRLRNEERPSVFFGTLPVFRTSRFLSSLTLLTILKITYFVQLTFSDFTAHICTSCCVLTMTNFYRRSSNCQPHHTVHISVVVSTTVFTITTARNTAISIPVLIALHFLCMAIVRAHVRLMLVHITIDK